MKSKIIGKIELNDVQIQKDIASILKFPDLNEEYSEFSIGVWRNHSIFNENGDYTDTQYRDYNSIGRKTELWDKIPYIASIITNNFEVYLWYFIPLGSIGVAILLYA